MMVVAEVMMVMVVTTETTATATLRRRRCFRRCAFSPLPRLQESNPASPESASSTSGG